MSKKLVIGIVLGVIVGIASFIVAMNTNGGKLISDNWNQLAPVCQWSTVTSLSSLSLALLGTLTLYAKCMKDKAQAY